MSEEKVNEERVGEESVEREWMERVDGEGGWRESGRGERG